MRCFVGSTTDSQLSECFDVDPEPFVLSPRVATPLQLQLVTLTREVVSSGQSTASRYFLLSVLNPARQPHETSHVFLGSFLVGIIPEHILAALSTPLNREVCHRQQDLLAWFSGDVTRLFHFVAPKCLF